MTGRLPTELADAITRELATWLEAPDIARTRAVVGAWGPSIWAAFRRVVTMQGLAPHLARIVPSSGLAVLVPADTRGWLVEQDDLNRRRIGRMHDELAGILAAAAGRVELMPLKGALLTTMPDVDAHARPMADLDLLVRPDDRGPMRAILEGLGYRLVPERAPRPTHDVFVDPGGGRVVSVDGEHPDNPRRVEVHVEVKRHLWGWSDDDDLTSMLWAGSGPGEVLGRPAILPRPESLFAHVVIHASSDLLVGRGRLVQWLDIGHLAPPGGDVADMPHPRVAYPALRLAARALPGAMSAVEVALLEPAVPRRLVRWAGSVALDSRCGLTTGRPPDEPAGPGARWERWRPDPWRLAVAYGDVPLPIALARHGATVARGGFTVVRRGLRG